MARGTETPERILENARELFFRYGFTKVTTDEIAAAAGVSKKTIYKYYQSKEALFVEVVGRTIEEFAGRMDEVMDDEEMEFPERLRKLVELRAGMLSSIGQPLVHDVQRNFPNLWKQVEERRRTGHEASFGRLVREGVERGVFRSDIDPAMLEMVYTSAITGVVNPDNLSRMPYTAGEATDAVMAIVFTGVLTDKARKRFPVRDGKRQRKEMADGSGERSDGDAR